MIDVRDRNHTPSMEEMGEYIRNPLFYIFCEEMDREYRPNCKIEFSKCGWEYGWHIKFKKSGKSLCIIYPRENYFAVLVVVGKKEKERVEEILPEICSEIQEIYHSAAEANEQRWLLLELEDEGNRYQDVLKLIQIRYQSK